MAPAPIPPNPSEYALAPLLSPYPPLELPPVGQEPIWWPVSAAQQAFLNCRAQLALGGGASGGGKTQMLAADAAQEYKNGALRALLLRTTLIEQQELEDIQQKMYEPRGARWSSRRGRFGWIFPSGAIVRPGYCANEKHLKQYEGNPYTWLGIDESGQHPEERIRRLLVWNAAPENTKLRVRTRLTSNPGNIGHGWQMKIFLRNRCPVHYPADLADDRPEETSVVPGKVYRGACWTDDMPVMKTTAFFPMRLSDNPFYGRTKLESLLSQPRKTQLQLLHGCWCEAEGLYFDFLRPDDVVNYATIGDAWWWNHFMAVDFGYGNSAAAGGMYAVNPNGKIFKIRERVERKMSGVNFAKGMCANGFRPSATPKQPAQAGWLTKMRPRDPQGPKISFCVMDRAMDKHDGNASGESVWEQMATVFRNYGVPSLKWDSTDSAGNAQALYNGLQNRRLVLTKDVPRSCLSLATRIIDDRKSVKKIHGSDLDDLYDETAGGYNTRISNSEAPARMALDEELEQMRRDGMDETSIARYSWQREQKLAKDEAAKARGLSLKPARQK